VIGIAAVLCLLAIGYGFGSGGVLGAMTGLVAALGAGSGVAIIFGAKGTDLSRVEGVRTAQRIGGFVASVACLLAAWMGGWRWGWLTGFGGYFAGAGLASVLALRAGGQLGNEIAVAQSVGLSEAVAGTIPVVSLDEFVERTSGGRPSQMDTSAYDGHPFE
jgi:hypothetical protein